MSPIAGQTAGPNGQNFFCEPRGGRGVLKNVDLFSNFFFTGNVRPQLVNHNMMQNVKNKN